MTNCIKNGDKFKASYCLATVNGECKKYEGILTFEKIENGKLYGKDMWKSEDDEKFNELPFAGQITTCKKFTLLVGNGINFECKLKKNKIHVLFSSYNNGDIGNICYDKF